MTQFISENEWTTQGEITRSDTRVPVALVGSPNREGQSLPSTYHSVSCWVGGKKIGAEQAVLRIIRCNLPLAKTLDICQDLLVSTTSSLL